jgi:hypothetical protein
VDVTETGLTMDEQNIMRLFDESVMSLGKPSTQYMHGLLSKILILTVAMVLFVYSHSLV